MENRVKIVFNGLSIVFGFAGFFFVIFGERYFPSGEILGIPLNYLGYGLFVSAVLVSWAYRFVSWYSRRD